ncbi:MAG: protein-L-isoaspartate(D-aspartate) O-methyltransferase [Alphaproteobacteria bacterium]|nr:protein-L-isoaspartate(D-aspartate) O-methyltransferase [Alphaproteobacteria bacterium]MDP6515776.1 protein-L-isoaspartate(D-aspartate) O-methyltransferase [Alphaproteobacteria bacterium]
MAALVRIAALAGLIIAGPASADDAATAEARARMVMVIEAHAAMRPSPALAPTITAPVLAVMGQVPRHEFVPAGERARAYQDRPLPIGFGQTISQPYIVALMTDLLEVGPGDKVLEIGTGSGYQAAVLAALGVRVHTIEIVPELGQRARARLARLGYDGVRVRISDGYHGWPDGAPFDAIVVTAAASHVPPPLVGQLAPGGRMVIPVGPPFSVQQLVLIKRAGDGTIQARQLLPVAFVPLTGEH